MESVPDPAHQTGVAPKKPARTRRGDLETVARILRATIAERRVDVLLRQIVDSLIECTGADSGTLALLRGEDVDLAVRRTRGKEDLPTDRVPLSASVLRTVVQEGRSLLVKNAGEDPSLRMAESVAEWGLISVLCVPLRFRERCMGAVFLENSTRADAFEPEDMTFAETLADQVALILENAMLAERSMVDSLTGTMTHATMEKRLAEELARAQRGGTPCSFLLIDLDHFKLVNDTYGHAVGSQVIVQFSELLRRVLRFTDVTGRVESTDHVVGRFGGDEFEVILSETSAEGLVGAARRVMDALRSHQFVCGDKRIVLTASLGGATFPKDGDTPHDLFLRADEALYQAKRQGRSQYVAWSPPAPVERATQELDELLLSRFGPDVISLLSRVVQGKGDVKEVLDQALQSTVRVTGADRGFALLVAGKDKMEAYSAFNLEEDQLKGNRYQISRGVVTRLIREARTLRSSRVVEDQTLSDCRSLHDQGVTSLLAVPIPGDSGPGGFLYLDSSSPKKTFSAEDELLLTRFAGFLGRALSIATSSHSHSLQVARLQEALASAMQDLEARYRFESLIGNSPAIRDLRVFLDHIVRFPYPVLITGETGTGKEVVAKAIHLNSPRSAHPMVAVNCAALQRDLLESELFGHVKGAFTGADRERTGLFRAAHQGTLFLDEIGETSEELQRKLLRVLQEGEFVPVGGTTPVRCDVRVIAATNRVLDDEVRQGKFREDLLYRLKVFRVALPPLRERRQDIPLLARMLLDKASTGSDGLARELAPETIELLLHYPWPGNVRELENAMRYAVAFSRDTIRPEHLPPEMKLAPGAIRAREIVETVSPRSTTQKPADELWSALIQKTLDEVNGNQSAAAKQLGISRSTLHYKMRQYGIRPKA